MTREEASGVLKAQADYYGKLFESMVTAGDYLELRELEKRMEALEMGADALRINPCDNCVGVGLAIAHGYTNMRTNPHQLDSIELDKSTENDVSPTSSPGPQPDPITGLVPCDFCTDTFDQKPLLQENKYKPYTRMMSTISIEGYNDKHQIEIDLWDGVNVYAAFEINYCPMCGRKLGVEG